MWYSSVINHVRAESIELFERTKCGDSRLSAMPTIIWTIGSAAIAHRLIVSLFRRFIFRRVPLWEITLQHLLFVWMVIYSVHFWGLVVNVVKFLVKCCYESDDSIATMQDMESEKFMQQWAIWVCAAIPAALYLHMRPKPPAQPLMIWITTRPWQRREMGAYGYYLNRPPSLQGPTATAHERALALRRAYSDSKALVREHPAKRRNSKSV